jgi:hypothetical protein
VATDRQANNPYNNAVLINEFGPPGGELMRLCTLFAFLAVVSVTLPVQGDEKGALREPRHPAHTVRLNGHTFTLPAGFEIEVAVPSSLVPRPITADFDEAGYLYVSDSSGTNDKVQDQLAHKPHRVLREVRCLPTS